MSLTKENKIEKIEIVGVYKAIQVKTATIVKEDGETISVSYDRKVLHPDSDMTNEDQEVKDVSNVVWTDEIKTAWSDYQASSKGENE
tara:strand:- start:48 stop:308 length:261 start_codon:yes stop_codon:yes gene_type:complete